MSLCSNCSVPVKPIVAIDIDGTLTEYHYTLHMFCIDYFGLMRETPYRWWAGAGNFEDHIGITQAQYREAKLAFRQGGNKRWAAPQAGLKSLCGALKVLRLDQKVEVWITTTRPWNRLDSVDPDTRFWLDQHFPVYDHLLYSENKYQELAEIVEPSRVVFVLDDLPEMYTSAQISFGPTVAHMIRRPHNITFVDKAGASTVEDLDAAAGLIIERVSRWHRAHG